MEQVKKFSILIVDDEKTNIITLTHILSGEYKLYAVKDSLEALETARTLKPDLILLDVIMPDMDGYEVAAALRDCEETRGIPVIFITGLSLGEVEFISKPFVAADVRGKVAKVLS